MLAVEFQTQVKNGIIEIPEALQKKIKDHVRVIVLSPEEDSSDANMIDQLFNNPLEIPDFSPIKRDAIYE